MYRSHAVIANTSGARREVVLEPWGMTLVLEAAESFEIEAESQQAGELQIAEEDFFVVYAWPGATLRVRQHGEIVHEESLPMPDLPEGMSTRDFMAVTGLNKIR